MQDRKEMLGQFCVFSIYSGSRFVHKQFIKLLKLFSINRPQNSGLTINRTENINRVHLSKAVSIFRICEN